MMNWEAIEDFQIILPYPINMHNDSNLWREVEVQPAKHIREVKQALIGMFVNNEQDIQL